MTLIPGDLSTNRGSCLHQPTKQTPGMIASDPSLHSTLIYQVSALLGGDGTHSDKQTMLCHIVRGRRWHRNGEGKDTRVSEVMINVGHGKVHVFWGNFLALGISERMLTA